MKNVQEQDYSKFQVLNQTCLRYSTTVPWRQHIGVADFYDQFVLRMTNIRLLRLQQAQETKGLTLNKAALRRDLCEVTLFVADAMVAFAFKTKDTELGARAKVTRTPILYGKQDDARTIAQNIHDLAVAAPLGLALAPFGVTTEKLAQLQEAIDDFSDAIPKPRGKITSKKSVTEQLAEEVRAAEQLLTDGMDRLIGQFQKVSPEFVREYRNARARVKKAATLGGDDTQSSAGAQPKAA